MSDFAIEILEVRGVPYQDSQAVKHVKWRLVYTCPDTGLTAVREGGSNLPDPNPDAFIPIDHVSTVRVEAWLWKNFEKDGFFDVVSGWLRQDIADQQGQGVVADRHGEILELGG